MGDVVAVSMLLKALGNPSFMVTGQKSGLPGGDSVGSMLSSITPSLAARLARRAIGDGAYKPIGSGASGRVGGPSMAAVLRKKVNSASVTTFATTDKVEFSGRAGYRSRPIACTGQSSAVRAYARQAEPSGPSANACVADPGEPRKTTLLDWPWDQPLPPTPPACQPQSYSPAPVIGQTLDLFA